jgi:hypothetical protein
MMEDRKAKAVSALKSAKSRNLKYYDATQELLSQGFTQTEVEDASQQFVYSDASPAGNEAINPGSLQLDQALAVGVIHQEAVDQAKSQLARDAGLGLMPGSHHGVFSSHGTLQDAEALAELKHGEGNTQLGEQASLPGPGLNRAEQNSIAFDPVSTTVISQVRSLRYFVIYGAINVTVQLLVLMLFRSAIVGSLIILHYTISSLLTNAMKGMLYVAQLTVILNLIILLMFVLSKSFERTQKLIKLSQIILSISLIANLLTGYIVGLLFGLYLLNYLRSVSDDIHTLQSKGAN